MIPTRTGSLPDCRPLLADADDLTVLFQPILDLTSAAVAGYQVLARFPGTAGPEVWFAAAAEAGLAAEVEALAVAKALARVPFLPGSAFLLVPVRAHLLCSPVVRAALSSRSGLDRVVVELTGSAPAGSPAVSAEPAAELAAEVADLQRRGARIALAGGARFPGVAPDLVVLGGAAARALTGTRVSAGAVPGAPLPLADGIETPDDLTAARSCAALGRGWLLGLPSAQFRPAAPSVTELVRTHDARARLADPVLPLVRPLVPGPGEPTVELDELGAPVALLLPAAESWWRKPVTLLVLPSAGAGETLRRALERPAEHRYDPVVCTDEDGRPLGLVRVADLVRATAG